MRVCEICNCINMKDTRRLRLSRFTQLAVACVAAVAIGAGPLHAALITTTFSSNNEFEGNMFDVTTFGNALLVTGLDVNVHTTERFNIDVYTKSGTYVGSETTPGNWTLTASGTGTGAGRDNPSFVDITDFLLPASSLTGMYVTVSPAVGFGAHVLMRYTNGSNTYSNADLQLDLGVGVGGLFGHNGNIFSPRTWNGTIYYDAVPEPTSLAAWGLLGVAGLVYRVRRRKLAS